MGLNVFGCCRLCLKDAASENATQVDLQRQEVAALVQELYDLHIKPSERGSKFICVPCYKDAIGLKKYLNLHQTKSKIVSLNQSILSSQAQSFEEKPTVEDYAPYCEAPTGYRPPSSTPADMLLVLEDCMRSPHFRDKLQDAFGLAHLKVSGSIYQEDTESFLDLWHPVQLYCSKCLNNFDDQLTFDEHHATCKYKCMYCKRAYSYYDTVLHHVCPKKDRIRKMKKKQETSASSEPVAKRLRTNENDKPMETVPAEKVAKRLRTHESDKPMETVPAEKPAAEVVRKESGLTLVPMPNLMPAPAEVPYIEGEANLDAELSNLLERWYGQGEETQTADLSDENGTITGSELYGRVIDTAYRNSTAPRKPAISVKPMSQLIETPVVQPLPATVPDLPSTSYPPMDTIQIDQLASTSHPPVDIIEIDDDDDVEAQQVVVPAAINAQLTKQGQPALSENDILNIVKHFRGIDENESYLIKAKINGAQKLICISKRKGDGSAPDSNTATIVNNNSALQSGSRKPAPKPVVITPTAKTPSVVHNTTTVVPPPKPTLVVKNVADINGAHRPSAAATSSSVPQLKIAHVQSLSQSHSPGDAQRILNGKPMATARPAGPRFAGGPRIITVPRRVPTSTVPAKTPPATQPAPQRIIVGSNTIKTLNTSPGRFKPIAPKPLGSAGATTTISSTTSTQQRIIVQRKVQTVVSRTSTGTVQNAAGSNTTAGGNALLRTQLLQQPPRIYPGLGGVPQNGNKATQARPVAKPVSDVNSKNFMVYKRAE